MKITCIPITISVSDRTASCSSPSAPKPRSSHLHERRRCRRRARRAAASRPPAGRARAGSAVAALEHRVVLAEVMHAVGAGDQAEGHDLASGDREHRGGDHRVQVPLAAEEVEVGEHARPSPTRPISAQQRRPGSGTGASGCGPAGSAGAASRRGTSCSFDSPARGWYSIGISLDPEPAFEALITISEANSMPGMRRSSRSSASRRNARMPQWASLTPVR